MGTLFFVLLFPIAICFGAVWKDERQLRATAAGLMTIYVLHGQEVTCGEKLLKIEWCDIVDIRTEAWADRKVTIYSPKAGFVKFNSAEPFYTEVDSIILEITIREPKKRIKMHPSQIYHSQARARKLKNKEGGQEQGQRRGQRKAIRHTA